MNNIKKCGICKDFRGNECLYWHFDDKSSSIWCYCVGKCKRGYSITEYCTLAGISLHDLLKQDFIFEDSKSKELTKMPWPATFISLSDPRAKEGLDYIRSRSIEPDTDLYYDSYRNGIVFPYYYGSTFVGAQIRLINPIAYEEEDYKQKIVTITGTKTGLLFYGWNQDILPTDVKYVVITEGSFNSLALKQSLKGLPNYAAYHFISTSGSGLTKHQLEVLSGLKQNGFKIIAAPDSDEAGLKMLEKMMTNSVITHASLTNDTEKDWNDLLVQGGKDLIVQTFLSNLRKV